MKTLKLFRNLLIAFILFWIFVTVASKGFIKSSYRIMTDYQTYSEEGVIKVTDSRATKVNGYVEGTFTNTTNNKIDKLFVVLQCFSKNDVLLGTEYTELTNIAPKEERKFRIDYQYDDVDYFNILTTQQEPENGEFKLDFEKMFNIKLEEKQVDWLTRIAVFIGILTAIRLIPFPFPF